MPKIVTRKDEIQDHLDKVLSNVDDIKGILGSRVVNDITYVEAADLGLFEQYISTAYFVLECAAERLALSPNGERS